MASKALMKDFVFLFTPWWGKIIGILLGYITAGPAGSVFGVLLGNLFDIGLHNVLHTPQWHYYRQAPMEMRNMFLPALFKIMGHIAKTDSRIIADDIDVARQIMREMRLYGINKRRAMQYYNDGKNPYFKLDAQLRVIKQICYYNPDLLALFAETQYRAAKVKPITDLKKDKLNDVFMGLGFKPVFPERVQRSNYYHQTYQNKSRQQQSQQQQRQSSQQNYRSHTNSNSNRGANRSDYSILGVQEGERSTVVKKAYRKIMSQVHPDKLIARGASEAEIDAATDRAQEVQAAYERIKKSRGFN